MPNLPGSTPARDLKMFRELFSNPDFQPDQLKIYPCVITKNAKIYKWLKNRKYKPYTQKQLFNLLINIKKIIPPYVRITRLIRDIPSTSIIAGNKISNLRQIIQQEMKKQIRDPRLSVSICQCIRCREIRGADYKMSNIKLIKREYKASGGKEIFLSYEDAKQNKLIAFLRLRLPQNSNQHSNILASKFACLKNSSIIREIHTYGLMTPLTQKGPVQHKGFGKKLIKQAEKLSKQAGYKKISVISGIGVRDYYRKLGYNLQNEYMIKKLWVYQDSYCYSLLNCYIAKLLLG